MTIIPMRRNWRFPFRFWLRNAGEALALICIFVLAFGAATIICAMAQGG